MAASPLSVTDRPSLSTSTTGRRRLAVAAAGAVGAIGRALVLDIVDAANLNVLWATLFVNVLGSLVLGYVVALHAGRSRSSPFSIPFAGIGIFGAFTTFSLFSTEVFELARAGGWLLAIGYPVGSIAFGCLAALLGIRFGRSR